MNGVQNNDRQRLDELLVDRALEGLEPDAMAELDQLLTASPDADADEFDRLAAALAVSEIPIEPMPMSVRQNLKTSSAEHLGVALDAPDSFVERSATLVDVRRPERSSSGLAWTLAAAAAILAVVSWWPAMFGGGGGSDVVEVTAAERCDAFLDAKPSDLVQWDWAINPEGRFAGQEIGGDVVWSSDEQNGFMRFEGLPELDPTKEQYQLWILDGEQAQPIDGGVFDQDQTVAINEKLRVAALNGFAVTVEKAGGVVVSEQGERLVLLALPPKAG